MSPKCSKDRLSKSRGPFALFLLSIAALLSLPALAQDHPDDAHSSSGEPAASAAPTEAPSADADKPPADHPPPDASPPGASAEHHEGSTGASPEASTPPASDDASPNEDEAARDPEDGPYVAPPAYDEPPGADDYGIGPDGKVHDPNNPEAADYEVGEATSDSPDGLGVDGKDYELPVSDFEGMEGLDPGNVEALREVTPAELGELDVDEGKGFTAGAVKQLDAQAHALEGIIDPQAINKIAKMYVPVLRSKILTTKLKTHDKLVTKQADKLAQKMMMLIYALGAVSLLSFLLLLMPLFLSKKYPGQGAKLFRISLYTALAMFGSFLLLSAILVGMRVVQAKMGQYTNPALVFSDGAFDAASKKVEDIAASPGLMMKPLEDVMSGKTDDLGFALLQNAAHFKKEVTVFMDCYKFYKSVQWILAYVPIALIAVAVLLFLLTIKDLIRDVIRVPDKVMKGEMKETEVFPFVGRRVKGETIATLCTLGVLLVLTAVSAVALSLLARPTMENFIRQLFVTIQYTTVSKQFDKTMMYIALLGVMVFIVLTVALSIVATALYLGKSQKIFRAWFNYGAPKEKYMGFFLGWRTVGVVVALAMPAVVLFSMSYVANNLIDKATNGAAFDWTMALLPAAIALPGALLVVILILGPTVIKSILKYKVEGPVADAAVAHVIQAVGR
jgi:hypothetical protein